MAKPDLGSKQKCQNCGTKFFDLNKDPITCPKCGTVLQAVPGTASRASSADADGDDEENETENGAEVVSLEDADSNDDSGKVKAPADGDEAEEDDTSGDDDDTFLEEEEEDDGDVSGLIDGDIEDDEER